MKGRIVLVSCLLLLCAGPVLGDDDKKDKENEHKEDADKKNNDELKTLKGKLQKIRVQIKDDKLPQKISEEQISVLKKKLEDFKNLKSEHEAKLASEKGDTSAGGEGELGLSDKEFVGQNVKANGDAAGVSGEQGASGGSGQGEAGPSSPADEQDDDNEAVQWGPATEEVVAEAMSDEGPQEQGAEGGPSNPTDDQAEEATPGPSKPASGASGSQGASDSSNDSAEPTSAAAAAAPAGPTAAAASPQVKHVDTLCDELLAGENKKNVLDEGEGHSQYNIFRKQYDKMVLNKTEYNISLKLLDTMLTNGQVEREKKNTLIKTFKKALYDKQYSEKLRNLISGVYAFAKRNNFIDGDKVKEGDYSKLFEYIGCMMNTLEL
ncbi:MSP7-like protein [Plasmodium vivax]|uniref:MSP7-like protein n=2 Tax=Plasmodium vivax TaxID=5855 RepID=A0A1G4HGS1_PLAVI|nr:merozoite surface protein 7 (MSP7) [Plasmodium vivax North Korean]SCO68583.1 MSP7-like protein [Plasmodium vivax]SCO74046.1 MSP7-like protein [Plasmodium vivax]